MRNIRPLFLFLNVCLIYAPFSLKKKRWRLPDQLEGRKNVQTVNDPSHSSYDLKVGESYLLECWSDWNTQRDPCFHHTPKTQLQIWKLICWPCIVVKLDLLCRWTHGVPLWVPGCTHLPCVHQMLQSDDAFAFALVVAQQIVLGLHDGRAGGRDGRVGQLPAQGTVHHVLHVLLLHLPGGAASLRGDGDLRYGARIHHGRRFGCGSEPRDPSGIPSEIVADAGRPLGGARL